jgi:hypothetical protein
VVQSVETNNYKTLITDKNISPNGKDIVYNEEVKINKVHGKDFSLSLKNQMFKFMMV